MTEPPPEETQILGSSRAFLDLMDHVSRVAPLERPVLIIGERGTGKELVAARLHFLSRRWGERLVKLNCAALPETLLDSELFGYEPGAFTGATRRRAGRFEQADGGSLFLDEIATMSLAAQEKLLRIIEYGQFERVGGSDTLDVDVRVIGATNVDLPAAAEAGDFRLDLLDRLAFDVLTVPPLRARRDDILDLAEHFGRVMAQEMGWPVFAGFTAPVAERLQAHHWPGNVRELKNVVERAVYRWPEEGEPIDDVVFDPFASPYRPTAPVTGPRAPDPLKKLADLSQAVPPLDARFRGHDDIATGALPDGATPLDLRAEMAAAERRLLEQALVATRYNQRAAADHLSLSYDQLRHALKKHDLV